MKTSFVDAFLWILKRHRTRVCRVIIGSCVATTVSLTNVLDTRAWSDISTPAKELPEPNTKLALKSTIELEMMRGGADTSLSLLAAWEYVRRTIKLDHDASFTTIDGNTASWFLGFVEGRLRCSVPDLWKRFILNAAFDDNKNTIFPLRGIEYPYEPKQLNLQARKTITIVVNPTTDLVRFSTDGHSLDLPLTTIMQSRREAAYIVDLVHDKSRWYIANHNNFGMPFTLLCINEKDASKKPVWRAAVRADGGGINYSGLGHHYVDIIIHESDVVVFGVSSGIAYIEAFDKQNGSNRYRFCAH